MCHVGDVWRDSVARVRMVSGPQEYPAIPFSEDDSWSAADGDRNSRVASPTERPTVGDCAPVRAPQSGSNSPSPLPVETVEPAGVIDASNVEPLILDGDTAAGLWMTEFEERYELEHQEKRAFEHFRSLEVEDYLRVYRNSRQFRNVKVDYFGDRMNSLCLHRLEQQYLKQGIEARRKQNAKDHEACIIKIQERAFDGVKKRLPPIKTAIGELEAPDSPTQLPKVTPNPPVLRESRRRNPSDIEWRRQKRLIEQEEAPKEGPRQFKFFPLVL